MELLQSDTVRTFFYVIKFKIKVQCYILKILVLKTGTCITLLYCFQKNAVAMCSTESWVNDVTDRKSYLPTELMGKEVRQ